MEAYLILEDGTVYTGRNIGRDRDIISEIVFNTSMTGYPEVLTDPSYAGQAVVMTYPLIGNYGISREDMERGKAGADGFIVHELARLGSNFRSTMSLQEFLIEQNVPGIEGIDTRALTKKLREKGTMNGMITTEKPDPDEMESVLKKIKEYKVQGVVEKVTAKEIKTYEPGDFGSDKVPVVRDVAVLDVGTKRNIIRCLLNRGCRVKVYPSHTEAEIILDAKPDGIMITNGPGDPKENTGVINQVKKLYDSGIPIFAICLGHQLMALACGADTEKMKYGHRGANHPVKDSDTGHVYISSQNHGYVVKGETIDEKIARPSFFNVNDGTIEGITYLDKPVFTVQFHPEACAGPKDSELLFDRFINSIG